MKEELLLECPFCGGKPIWFAYSGDYRQIACDTKGCILEGYSFTETKWNTRASHPSTTKEQGVFCLIHKKVMTNGICDECETKHPHRELDEKTKKEFYNLFTQSYPGDSGIGGNDPQDPDCQFNTYPDDVWQWIVNNFSKPNLPSIELKYQKEIK